MSCSLVAAIHFGSPVRNSFRQSFRVPRLGSRPLSCPPALQLESPSGSPVDQPSAPPEQVRCQFTYRPVRPAVQSSSLALLPPAPFTLRIVSLSYNRTNVHALLSPSFPAARSSRYVDPAGHFTLTAIAPHLAASSPIPPHIRSLGSCFAPADRARWLARRAKRRPPRAVHELRLTFALRIKELHKSAVIRKSIRKRWVAALKLVVQYGSRLTPAGLRSLKTTLSPTADNRDEIDLIELDPKEADPERWLLSDYYYIVHPNLSLNAVGLPELVHSIRAGLASIKRSASYDPRGSPRPRMQAGVDRPSRAQVLPASSFDRQPKQLGLDSRQANRNQTNSRAATDAGTRSARWQQYASGSGAQQQAHSTSHSAPHAHAQDRSPIPGIQLKDPPPKRLPTPGSHTYAPRTQPPRRLTIPKR